MYFLMKSRKESHGRRRTPIRMYRKLYIGCRPSNKGPYRDSQLLITAFSQARTRTGGDLHPTRRNTELCGHQVPTLLWQDLQRPSLFVRTTLRRVVWTHWQHPSLHKLPRGTQSHKTTRRVLSNCLGCPLLHAARLVWFVSDLRARCGLSETYQPCERWVYSELRWVWNVLQDWTQRGQQIAYKFLLMISSCVNRYVSDITDQWNP